MRRHLLALSIAIMTTAAGTGCAPGGVGSDDAEDADARGDAFSGGVASTLWIHGRSASGKQQPGNYGDFSYWGPAGSATGVNPRAVNWDGRGRISETNGWIRDALDCFCTGPNGCYVAAHSAGDAQIGYALDLYGATPREIHALDASGACKPTGETQTGWNVLWVDVAGGAAGGTELADLGYWAVSDPLTSDLRTGTVRSLYDHNNTQGAAVYRFAGAKGTLYSSVLPGQDDEVIAYHSSGGLAGTGKFCNPGDWFCDGTLGMGESGTGKVPRWSNHFLALRDDGEKYDHYTRGAWGGIVGPMAKDVADYAR